MLGCKIKMENNCPTVVKEFTCFKRPINPMEKNQVKQTTLLTCKGCLLVLLITNTIYNNVRIMKMPGPHIKTKRLKLNKAKTKYTLQKLKELSRETRLIESHNS